MPWLRDDKPPALIYGTMRYSSGRIFEQTVLPFRGSDRSNESLWIRCSESRFVYKIRFAEGSDSNDTSGNKEAIKRAGARAVRNEGCTVTMASAGSKRRYAVRYRSV